ncbi:MAG: hypothetical protein M0Z95_07330, partial [Actinomycetota bacterium]|nr:hypothetical protein [Actinomycetota bacterium]
MDGARRHDDRPRVEEPAHRRRARPRPPERVRTVRPAGLLRVTPAEDLEGSVGVEVHAHLAADDRLDA